MPSDRESPPYIHRLPCGPDTREWPILWRNLWAWFCANSSSAIKELSKIHKVVAISFVKVCVLCIPLSAVCPAGFPTPGCWSPVGQSSLSRPRPPSTHTLPESETNGCVSEHSGPVDKISQMIFLALIFIQKSKKSAFENPQSTLTALQTPRPSVLPQS